MKFTWSEEKVELYKRASEYTGFNEELGEKILGEIGYGRTIFDIGCGMSYLSIYLSEYSKGINCIDTDKIVLKNLKKELGKRKISNIKIINEDYKKIIGNYKNIDCIIACNFLRNEEELNNILGKCKTLIIIKNTRTRKNIYKYKKKKIEDMEEILASRNITYKKFIHNGEFGQPLKSLEEARNYYNSYSYENISVEEVKNKLLYIDNEEFPYYMPKYKNAGVIIVGGLNE